MVDLGRRLEKLERAQPAARVPKLVRLCVSDDDEGAALQGAKSLGLNTDSSSGELQLIRLVPLTGS